MSSDPEADARGHVFLIAAPSGTGKTTLCRRILEEDSGLQISVSHTTRAPREGEIDGVHYHFVDVPQFRVLNDEKAFLEHAEYGGNNYGTSWRSIEDPLDSGHDVVLEIEVQGAAQVRDRMPSACLIFLLPPSLEILEERLRGRRTDTEEVIQRRMTHVDNELAAAKLFDYAIVNDDLERAVREVLDVIASVREGRGDEISEKHGREIVLERWEAAQGRL